MNLLFIILFSSLGFAARYDIDVLETQKIIRPKSKAQDQRPLEWYSDSKKIRLARKIKKNTIYDTIVNFDQNGNRIVHSVAQVNYKSHLFFTGCSITFGEGIADNETFPFILSNVIKDSRVVNMGLRGSGIQDHVYLWSTLDFKTLYKEEKGMMIYTIIPDIFARLGRSWRYLNWAFPYSTVYKKKDGIWSYDGINKDKFDYTWSQWMKNLHSDYWWLRLTNYHSTYIVDQSIRPTVELIQILKKEYLAQYPQGRFVISWMRNPLTSTKEKYQEFLTELKKEKIEYWEPSSYEDVPESVAKGLWHIPRDGHPTALANKLYADFLKKKIMADN